MAGSNATCPNTSSNISLCYITGAQYHRASPVRSMMLDSIPMPTFPPSIIISTRPSISWITWAAVVGLGLPDVLALEPPHRRRPFGSALKPRDVTACVWLPCSALRLFPLERCGFFSTMVMGPAKTGQPANRPLGESLLKVIPAPLNQRDVYNQRIIRRPAFSCVYFFLAAASSSALAPRP